MPSSRGAMAPYVPPTRLFPVPEAHLFRWTGSRSLIGTIGTLVRIEQPTLIIRRRHFFDLNDLASGNGNKSLPSFFGRVEQHIAIDVLALQAQIDAFGDILDLLLLFADCRLKLVDRNLFLHDEFPDLLKQPRLLLTELGKLGFRQQALDRCGGSTHNRKSPLPRNGLPYPAEALSLERAAPAIGREPLNQLLRQDFHLQETEHLSNRSPGDIVVGNARLLELPILSGCCGLTAVAVSLCRLACITTLRARAGPLVVTAAEQDNIFSDDVCDIHLSALLVVIAPRLQPALDMYLLSFG